jgi:hypothetical protein
MLNIYWRLGVPNGKYHICDRKKYYLEVQVLNANVKLAYAEDKWDCKAREVGIACLEEVVCSFANVLKLS